MTREDINKNIETMTIGPKSQELVRFPATVIKTILPLSNDKITHSSMETQDTGSTCQLAGDEGSKGDTRV